MSLGNPPFCRKWSRCCSPSHDLAAQSPSAARGRSNHCARTTEGRRVWSSGPRASCDRGRTSACTPTLVCAPRHAFPLYSCSMTSREHGGRGERTYAERATRPSRQCRGPSESRALPPARGSRPPRPACPEHPTPAVEQARRGPAPPPAPAGIAPAARPTAGEPVRGITQFLGTCRWLKLLYIFEFIPINLQMDTGLSEA